MRCLFASGAQSNPGEEVLTQVARQERVYREHIVQLTSTREGTRMYSITRPRRGGVSCGSSPAMLSTVEPCSEAHKYPSTAP
jgi:hypothetical protein